MDEQGLQVPSKTALKRQAQEIEELARDLVEMPAASVGRLKLEPQLLTIVERARDLRKGARKREIKHLAGLLRNDSEQLETIRRFHHGVSQQQLEDNSHFHALENWREGLCDPKRRVEVQSEIAQALPALDMGALDKLLHGYQGPEDKKCYRQIFTLLRKAAEIQDGEE
ncbi:MAG: ribosome biogenesis factor YjgA [Desulfuromonadaceae bacterium]|jgi:ribosome-associated protein|nr:ribosome biogenesis factor YjgA [Desulfuromonas sp.]MDY0185395.1 ribosome biogenesis factor YjgA [Desulfuromonadaceae bacterium]